MEVAECAVGAGQFAEQQRAPVAQPRDEAAELVAGVGLRYRRGAVRDQIAGQEPHALGGPQPVGLQAQVGGEVLVEHQ